MELKDNLKKLRNRRYYSLPELAERIEVGNEELEELEAGKGKPNDEIVSKLAAFFCVSKEELYSGLKEESLNPGYTRLPDFKRKN